jgi:phospholipid transport system transporter-binding protein
LTVAAPAVSAFEVVNAGRSQVVGLLTFTTVTHLLPLGTAAIAEGHASIIDLAGVTGSDSSGLALLIEWLSVARGANQAVRYENMPAQLRQLARLSEVEELVNGVKASEPAAAPAVPAGQCGAAGSGSSPGSTSGSSGATLPSETL